MEFGISKEQTLLQESVLRQLDRQAPLERVQRFAVEAEPRADDVWDGLCELGIPGMVIPEQFGGIGCSLLDAALVAETLGSRVAPIPFVATAVVAPLALSLAGSEQQQARWLGELADGKLIAGVAIGETVSAREEGGIVSAGSRLSGKALFVLDFEADLYIVADQNRRLFVVEANAAGLQRRSLTTIDGTRRVGELVFEDVAAELLHGSDDPRNTKLAAACSLGRTVN